MTFKELQGKSIAELHRLLAEGREKLRELRFKDANKQLKNIREIRRQRLEISRLLTMINKQK